jgi:hypothetical protein
MNYRFRKKKMMQAFVSQEEVKDLEIKDKYVHSSYSETHRVC